MLTRVGLPGYGTRNIANLSGVEAQRVSIARALANSPLVLLLDEPTSALDYTAKAGVEALLRDIILDTRLTCVIVTHYNVQAARIATRAMIVDHGRTTRIGNVQEVLHA